MGHKLLIQRLCFEPQLSWWRTCWELASNRFQILTWHESIWEWKVWICWEWETMTWSNSKRKEESQWRRSSTKVLFKACFEWKEAVVFLWVWKPKELLGRQEKQKLGTFNQNFWLIVMLKYHALFLLIFSIFFWGLGLRLSLLFIILFTGSFRNILESIFIIFFQVESKKLVSILIDFTHIQLLYELIKCLLHSLSKQRSCFAIP